MNGKNYKAPVYTPSLVLRPLEESDAFGQGKKALSIYRLRVPERPYFETERLIVREFEKSDLEAFKTLLEMPEVPGWMMQRGRAEAFLEWQIQNYAARDIINGAVCLGIFKKDGGALIGAVAAERHDDLGETEIAYNLLPEARGFGYATEACAAVSRWALGNFPIPYIIGTASADNIKSQRVLLRCGYTFIEEKNLLVHILGERGSFYYYRKYRV